MNEVKWMGRTILTLLHETVVQRLHQVVLESTCIELYQFVLVVEHKLRVAGLATGDGVVAPEGILILGSSLHIGTFALLLVLAGLVITKLLRYSLHLAVCWWLISCNVVRSGHCFHIL